jgi:hypothetical protein
MDWGHTHTHRHKEQGDLITILFSELTVIKKKDAYEIAILCVWLSTAFFSFEAYEITWPSVYLLCPPPQLFRFLCCLCCNKGK